MTSLHVLIIDISIYRHDLYWAHIPQAQLSWCEQVIACHSAVFGKCVCVWETFLQGYCSVWSRYAHSAWCASYPRNVIQGNGRMPCPWYTYTVHTCVCVGSCMCVGVMPTEWYNVKSVTAWKSSIWDGANACTLIGHTHIRAVCTCTHTRTCTYTHAYAHGAPRDSSMC